MPSDIEEKTPETSQIPYRTAVEISNDRRFGIGGSKATLYSCNFAQNDEERSGKKKKEQNEKRSWVEWWMDSGFIVCSLSLGISLIIAGSFSGSTGSTIFLIVGAIALFMSKLVIFLYCRKLKTEK